MSARGRPNVAHRCITLIALVAAAWPVLSLAQTVTPASSPPIAADPSFNWTGPYLGGNLGVTWGSSAWTAGPGLGGSINQFDPIDSFDEGGSWFTGIQGGYNQVLPSRLLLGAEADIALPAWQKLPVGENPFGVSIGGAANFASPALGPVSYVETAMTLGTLRGRVGYAPGSWLVYATGGLAWTYDRQSLTQISTGTTDTPFLWRLGWAAGAGIATPLAPHWTARLEYLYTDYGKTTTAFLAGAQSVTSDLQLQELRLGLSYQFGGEAAAGAASDAGTPAEPAPGNIAFHEQFTVVGQGYPAIHSPYQAVQSLPGGGEVRETSDADLYVGLQPWSDGELWVEPGIDQGFGLAASHGMAGFASAEAYKIGATYPYSRADRYFLRQTFALGGAAQNVDEDMDHFAGKTTENRLVLTIGKLAVVDIFDTNKYANDPKNDFLNWSLVNTGTFDYAADAWGYTYGAAAEWYQGNWTLRQGFFDLSATPTGAGHSAPGYGLSGDFNQFELVSEIEHRHQLWGQPGAIRVTGFLARGNAGSYKDAITLYDATGLDINDATAAVRHYQSRPGASMNFEQQITDTIGVFARAGWADGNVEPWDFTDIDRTGAVGAALSGKPWGRPDDTIGLAEVINGISKIHQEWLNDGGMGVLIGDGQLSKYGREKILESYYSYAIMQAMKLSLDYQFVDDPGYNPQRGPASIFGLRLHVQI